VYAYGVHQISVRIQLVLDLSDRVEQGLYGKPLVWLMIVNKVFIIIELNCIFTVSANRYVCVFTHL